MRTLILTTPGAQRFPAAIATHFTQSLVVTDRDQAWAELHGHPYDLLVLAGLPWRQARPLLQRLRHSRSFALPDPWIPVLVIDPGEADGARAHLLEAGADACLPKDCDATEVMATIRALWRRRTHSSRPIVVPAELVIHRVSRVVMKQGQAVALTPPEFAALAFLMEARPEVVSGRALREHLGQRHDVRSTQSVIFQLRTKLGRKAIQTVRGSGYRLAQDARWSDAPADDAGPAPIETLPAALEALPACVPPLAPVPQLAMPHAAE